MFSFFVIIFFDKIDDLKVGMIVDVFILVNEKKDVLYVLIEVV